MATHEPDFRLFFESSPGLYLVLDPELKIVAVTDAYASATLTKREQILGRGIFDVFPDNPDDPHATGVATLNASLQRVLADKRPDAMAVQKYDVQRPNGEGFEARHWSPINTPVLEGGVVRYIIHQVSDVTEFVRLQERGSALRTREGAMEAEIVQRGQDLQEANRQLRVLQGQLESRVKDTSEKLQQSEEQLRQAQKAGGGGRLAGGIAHDFNNILTVILSYSAMLHQSLDPEDAMARDLDEITRAGKRAADLTRQLLAFSRQQVLEARVLDLNESLASVNQMLVRLLGEDIEVKRALAPQLGRVKADPNQMEQVLMNLVVNARDAMPRGGKLTIETGNVHLDQAYAREHMEVTPGDYVMLAVSDTGCGMTKEVQARIFEPFFTTKEQGKGTGLGLAMVFGIVKQSGGHIWVYSEPGHGTTFKIYLPRVEGQKNQAPREWVVRPARGTETVLLVEDDAQVRAVASAILRRAGYSVLEAPSPKDALALVSSSDAAIELLITDVIMPGMGGRQLADHLCAARPKLKVLFMSGYTDDAILHHGVLEAGVPFLQKPLTPSSLERKVREVLDSPP